MNIELIQLFGSQMSNTQQDKNDQRINLGYTFMNYFLLILFHTLFYWEKNVPSAIAGKEK